jgi:hypothetical protein
MATKSSFKMQCPHCEARIPIKDESQIGEEINCPKCKKPFVVEDPEDTQSTEAENKRRPAKARKGKEERDEGAPKDKKQSKLVLGLGLAGVAVVLLAVAAFFLLKGGDSKPTGSVGTTVGASGPAAGAQATKPAQAPTAAPSQASSPGLTSVGNPSNLLPNETEVVLNIQMQEMLKNRFGKMIFDSAGASQAHSFKGRYGIPVEEIDRVLVAGSASEDWVFLLLRSHKAIKLDAVKKALRLHEPEIPIQGQEYFVSSYNWLEAGSPLKLSDKSDSSAASTTAGARPLAVRLTDPQTLVLADVAPMKNFLAAKGQPPTVKQPPAPPASGAPGAPGQPPAAGGRRPRQADSAPLPPDGSAPTELFQAPPRPPGGGGGGALGGGGGGIGQPQGPDAPTNRPGDLPPVVSSSNYMTINPRLKMMLDRVEAKPPILFSWAVDAEADKKDSIGLDAFALGEDLRTVGMSLQMKEKIVGHVGLECKHEDEAKRLQKGVETDLRTFAGVLRTLGLDVKIGTGAGGGPAPAIGGPGAAGGRARRPGGAAEGGGAPPPPGTGGAQNAPAKAGPAAQFNVGQQGPNVLVTMDMQLDANVVERIAQEIEPYLVRVQGELEMATTHPNPNHVALAVRLYRESNQQFPRGTVNRKRSAARASRPWPPDQRVSWMADLLPFLGYDGVYNRIKLDRSWQDSENAIPAVSLVSAFLDGRSHQKDWYIRYPGMKYDVAATHFVGVAGIGLDAAEYSANDPSVAKKLGIFGYDRSTRVADITDGLANTIMMLQVPRTFKAPWIAGGGSTIRGVPETRSIQPFSSTQHDGKRGTFAIMADGSVRFIAENISDDVFKALCTIKGGEPKLNLDKVAPMVPPPADEQPVQKAELEAKPPARSR